MASAGLPAWLVSNAPTAAVEPADNTTRQWWPAQALGQHAGTAETEEQSRCHTAASQADEEESLDALTALCVQPRAQVAITAVASPNCGTKAVVAALSDPAQDALQRTCTQDSDSTADLLPLLHAGDITQRLQSMPHEPGGKHDTSVELFKGPAHLGACKADGAAALAGAEGEDGYDMPLVSKRKKAILDIMCGRSPIDTVGSPVRASPQRVPFLLASIPAASSSSLAVSPIPGGSGILPSHSPGESGDPSAGVASTCDASLLPAAGLASAPLAPTAVLPDGLMSYTSPEVVRSARVLYVGVFLTSESREVLVSMVPAVHPLLRGDHMTLVYMPSVKQLLQFPVGAEVQVRVLGSAANARVQAVFVEAPAWLETSSASAHITISVAAGAQAVEAGQLICDALQEAALASTADWPDATAAAAGGGAPYQHFDEPLPLVGRLGVRLAVPAATAASMGWSSAAGGAGRAAGGEVEVVVYSADELAGCGCFEINRDALEAFHRQHGHLLGAQASPAPGFSPQSLLTTVRESQPSSACGTPLSGRLLQPASAQSSPAGSSPWLPALLSASTPPAVTPTASSPHTAAGSAAFAPAAAGVYGSPLGQQSPPSGGLAALLAARNSSGSTGAAPQPSPPNGGGLGALLRAAGHNRSSVSPYGPTALSHSTAEQPPFFSLRGSAAADTPVAADTAAAVDASLPDSPRSTSSGDSGSSSSSMDAVQFFSAVHVGDYVAVRPFVPTEGNERLLQGYVREFACDEPFQAEGVLVVLTDNTIGYVAVVLESTAARGGSGSSAAAAASAAGLSIKQASPASCSSTPFNGLSLDPTFALGSSTATAAAAGGAGSSGAAQDTLEEIFMLEAGCADTPVVLDTHGGQPRRRNARDAERDLQLWREFEALQQQHGEVLCSTILESCNQDFAEAIELIKGQAGGMQGFPAATAAADSGSAAAASPQSAAARVSAGDDGLVSQLALALGLVPEHALQLARLVPDTPAEAVVQALQQHSGDVGLAADALLSTQATAADADSSASSPTRSSTGPRHVSGSEQHSAMSFMAGRDGSHVAAVRQLQAMVPGLGEDMAGMLLDAHGGDLLKVAEALEEMQARELEARSAAAAAVPGSSTRTAPAAGPSTSAAAAAGSSLAGIAGLSEADQLAILAAMGELDPTEAPAEAPQQQQQQQVDTQQYSHSPPQWQSASSPRGSPKAATHSPQSPPQVAAVAGSSRFCPPVHVSPPQHPVRFTQPPPPPPPPQRDSLDRRVAKEQADELYKTGTKFSEGANILLTAAQDALNSGDNKAFREYKARADELRKQARAAIEKAQSISWSANNAHSQVWEVDLHGLGVTKAVAKFERQFRSLRGMDHPGGVLFRVIVGRGLHSEGNIPKIKLGILQYMKEQGEAAAAEEGKPWGVTYGIDPTNPGVINVHIPADAETEE